MNQRLQVQQPQQATVAEQTHKSKGVKDEKKFIKFISWVKRNRRKAERFNNKIKKTSILMECESVNSEQTKRKLQKQLHHQRSSKINQPNQTNIEERPRENSNSENNNQLKDKNGTIIRKDSQSNAVSTGVAPSQFKNSIKKQSNETQEIENEIPPPLIQNSSSLKVQQDLLQKRKEEKDNEFKLQIRREMMVDDTIGGKLSYKLMLKMEQFFDHYQLKNPKEKEKIINHLHYEKDEDTLQKPNFEQEGAFADDKDFIRRDSYWAHLFAKENNAYAIRTPDQFARLSQSDLNFPHSQSLIDTNISETIQDKINQIKVIRFKDRIDNAKQIAKVRDEKKQKILMERKKQLEEQKEQEQVMLEIAERQKKMKEKMQQYDFSTDETDIAKGFKGQTSQTYSINQGKRNSKMMKFDQGPLSNNILTTTATQDFATKSQIGDTYSTILEGQSSLKKRNQALDLQEIEFDQINSIQELKKKKNAINKLYEKLFPIETKTEPHDRQNKSRFFKLDETPLNQQKDQDKFINLMSPSAQNSQRDFKKSINHSQIYRTPSQQLSRQSSISSSQKLINQSSITNQQDFNRNSAQSRKTTIQIQKDKQKKLQEQAPAKLKKQYQTFFQLQNIPYMSEIGLDHDEQLQHYANMLEDYCPNPFEKITQLNEIIQDYTEQKNPELVKNKIYQGIKPIQIKPRFEMKKFDENEFLQKKVNFQYRDHDKIDKLNNVDSEQNQILTHNIEKRIKSFSSSFIKRPQTVFYKEKYENLTKETKDEFEKTKDFSKSLQKVKTTENKKVKRYTREMKQFITKHFVYTPQEQKQLQYNFPPYPLEKKIENDKHDKSKNPKQAYLNSMQRIQTALLQTRKIHQQ